MNEDIGELRTLIDRSSHSIAFTGAGISTESGIPDFRSPGGIWSRTTPIYFDEFMRSEEARRETWRRKLEIDRDIEGAEPNRGHRALAKMMRTGRLVSIITQNIDGLHQESGVPETQIIELHGNGTYATCLSCGLRHELGPIKKAFRDQGVLPTCRCCGGIVKAATISFGQAMPEAAMQRAHDESSACDLFLVVGSSLTVHPAAGFPILAKQNGAALVILNRDATDLDGYADLVINREIGPVLGEVANVN